MFSGTTLVTHITSEQINRAVLELLNKINYVAAKIDALETRIKELENAQDN